MIFHRGEEWLGAVAPIPKWARMCGAEVPWLGPKALGVIWVSDVSVKS